MGGIQDTALPHFGGEMLELKPENIQGLEMSFDLDEREESILANYVMSEAFHILQKLMEQEVRLMNLKLLNTSSSNPQEILANHAVAKAAGMFYAGLMQRLKVVLSIQEIKSEGIGTADNPEKPPMLDEVN
jgi:hypothetical protein